jgi:translation elongation factor EF-4
VALQCVLLQKVFWQAHPLWALIFDSCYDAYRAWCASWRVADGCLCQSCLAHQMTFCCTCLCNACVVQDPLRALIFDSYYNAYRGVVCMVQGGCLLS